MGVKGSWKRPTDSTHAPKWVQEQIDMGRLGCKKGFHYFIDGKECKYCGKTKEENTKD